MERAPGVPATPRPGAAARPGAVDRPGIMFGGDGGLGTGDGGGCAAYQRPLRGAEPQLWDGGRRVRQHPRLRDLRLGPVVYGGRLRPGVVHPGDVRVGGLQLRRRFGRLRRAHGELWELRRRPGLRRQRHAQHLRRRLVPDHHLRHARLRLRVVERRLQRHPQLRELRQQPEACNGGTCKTVCARPTTCTALGASCNVPEERRLRQRPQLRHLRRQPDLQRPDLQHVGDLHRLLPGAGDLLGHGDDEHQRDGVRAERDGSAPRRARLRAQRDRPPGRSPPGVSCGSCTSERLRAPRW